jgi:Caspase domain
MKIHKYFTAIAVLLMVTCSHAYELKIDTQTVKAGQAVAINIDRVDTKVACAVEIKYGDGNSKIIKFEKDAKAISDTYVYKHSGRYKVELEGKMIFQGLGSTFHCIGRPQNIVMSVETPSTTSAQTAQVIAPPVAVPTPAPVVATAMAPKAIVPKVVPGEVAALNAAIADQSPQVFANRRALVIGNDSYKSVKKLDNAREDAKAIGENLESVGYQVTLKLDVTEKEMKSVIRNFANQVEGGDEVFFFFAGHGVQLGAANYLLPIDITGENEAQVKDEAIQLQRILDDMAEKKAKFTLAMIDACRDNPFKLTAGRAIGGRGLAPTTAATGQMIIFSAGSGQQALDKLGSNDNDKNGLFTRVFIKEMQKPGQSVDRVVKNVRTQVVRMAKAVGHDQVPSIYDQVIGDFYFKK